jgi:tight adherence protein C
MTGGAAGATVGLAFGAGLALLLAWDRVRRPLPLTLRIGPYLGIPGATARAADDATIGPSALVRAIVGRSRSGPSDTDLAARLVRAGSPLVPGDFRLERVVWAAVGALLGLGAGLVLTVTGSTAAASVVLGGTGAVAGWLARDLRLRRDVRTRQHAIERELPTLADLLALGVSAGASPVSALERAASTMSGPLAQEVARVVADIRGGRPVDVALGGLSSRSGVRAVQRFVDGILVALERGTPLAAVVRAQAEDARTEERRRLVELAGRKDVSMLVPVVFLVLPTVVLVALFPGVQSLRLVVP